MPKADPQFTTASSPTPSTSLDTEAPAASVPGSADAVLLAICKKFSNAATKRHAVIDHYAVNGEDPPAELIDPLNDREAALYDALIDTRAVTLAGVSARACALIAFEPDMAMPRAPDSAGWREDIARAVIRDLLAVTGGLA